MTCLPSYVYKFGANCCTIQHIFVPFVKGFMHAVWYIRATLTDFWGWAFSSRQQANHISSSGNISCFTFLEIKIVVDVFIHCKIKLEFFINIYGSFMVQIFIKTTYYRNQNQAHTKDP